MRMADVEGWMEADGMTDGRLPVARRDHLLIEKRRRPPASNATTMLKSRFQSVLVVMSRSRERMVDEKRARCCCRVNRSSPGERVESK